jgi:hypothetical protein
MDTQAQDETHQKDGQTVNEEQVLYKAIDKIIRQAFFGDSHKELSSGTSGDNMKLTIDRLLSIQGLLVTPLYYAEVDAVQPGLCMVCNEPEFIIIHPDDFEQVKAMLPHRKLVPLRDRPIDVTPMLNWNDRITFDKKVSQ